LVCKRLNYKKNEWQIVFMDELSNEIKLGPKFEEIGFKDYILII